MQHTERPAEVEYPENFVVAPSGKLWSAETLGLKRDSVLEDGQEKKHRMLMGARAA